MPKLLNLPTGGTPAKKVLEITSFAGIDLSSSPADVDRRRSPDAPNMMPDSLGNPVKRPGFELFGKFPGRLNGSFQFGEQRIIHAGKALFNEERQIWDGMADEISCGIVTGNRLFIFDGQEAICFDGEHVVPLCDIAYIPTVLISKNADEAEKETVLKGDGTSTEFVLPEEPKEILSVTKGEESIAFTYSDGKIVFETAPEEGAEIKVRMIVAKEPGGSAKEEFNLISSRWKESFLCDTGTEKKFSLSKGKLFGNVRAWIMDEKGEMQEKTEDEDFSVDRETGKIEFFAAVPKTPVTGQDNLVIEAGAFFEGYRERINHCRRGIAFDSGGTSTRIFLCGNKDEPNRDHWCAAGDPTYWPDTYYSEIGSAKSEIVGYSVIEGYLAAHISPAFDGRSIVLRTANVDEEGNVSFPIIKHLQGEEAVAPYSFVYMEKEPLFLTKRGVYAITAEDVSGEKYTQNRSFYINKVLCNEDIENAFCGKWRQFYVVLTEDKMFLLDTSQKSYQRGEPLSTFQYECYLWKDFEARIFWEQNGKLFFGDEEGNIFRFTEGRYSDNGRAINAYWTVPDFSGESFWRNKTIRTVAIQAAAVPQNELRLEVRDNGFWKVLKEWKGKISYFAWDRFSWDDFSWSGNSDYRTITLKTKIKKFDKAGFRIVGDSRDRGFGLYGFAIEFEENDRFRK